MSFTAYIIDWWKKNIHTFLKGTGLFTAIIFIGAFYLGTGPTATQNQEIIGVFILLNTFIIELPLLGILTFHVQTITKKHHIIPPVFPAMLWGIHAGQGFMLFKSFDSVIEKLLWTPSPLLVSMTAMTIGHVIATHILQKKKGGQS